MKRAVKNTLAVAFAASVLLSGSGCLKYTSNILEVTKPAATLSAVTTDTNQPSVSVPTSQLTPDTTAPEISTAPQVNPSQEPSSAVNQEEKTTAQTENTNPSAWSKQEIVSFVTSAVNKTKAFTGQVSVNHSESFSATVTKAPGGSVIQNIANKIIGSVVKPTDEVMNFSGGKAVNSEGETVPLLLPKRNNFSLNPAGVAQASATQSGRDIVVTLKLVKETGTLTAHPPYHAGSLGYLDASDVDLGPVTLDYLDIDYTGSTMVITVNENGYAAAADYSIPIEVRCKGKALGITAEVECVGEQSEKWTVNW